MSVYPPFCVKKQKHHPFHWCFPPLFSGFSLFSKKKSSPYYSSLNLPPYIQKPGGSRWLVNLPPYIPKNPGGWWLVGWFPNRKAEAEGCVCHRFLRIGLGSVAGTACSAVAFSGDLDLAGGGGLRVLRFFGGEGKRDEMGWMWKEMMFQEMGCFFLLWILTYDRTRRCGRCM